MVSWRSQADEIEALRAEVRTLRGEMASQQAALEEMDTLVEQMVLCGSMAQMKFVLRRATTLAGRRQKERHELCVSEPAEHRAVRRTVARANSLQKTKAPSFLTELRRLQFQYIRETDGFDRRYSVFRFSAPAFPRLGSALASKDSFCPSANP